MRKKIEEKKEFKKEFKRVWKSYKIFEKKKYILKLNWEKERLKSMRKERKDPVSQASFEKDSSSYPCKSNF